MSRKTSYKLGDFLEVSWNDIICFSGWEVLGGEGVGTPPHACVSYGFLVSHTTDYLTLSATKGINGRVEYNQSITIPLGCVSDVKKVVL